MSARLFPRCGFALTYTKHCSYQKDIVHSIITWTTLKENDECLECVLPHLNSLQLVSFTFDSEMLKGQLVLNYL